MKNSQEKMFYLSDGEIYSLWKYLNGFRLVNRSGVLNFDDLIASGESSLFISKFLNLLRNLGIKDVKGLVFHKDLYLKYNNSYERLKEKSNAGTLAGFQLKTFEFLEKLIADDNVEFIYKSSFGVFDFLFYENALGFLEFFEFSANLPVQYKNRIENFVNSYIENFIQNELLKERDNFYQFNKQKKVLFDKLSSHESDYGKSFIFEYPKAIDYAMELDKEYLFIHTLVALEKLGYFIVEEIWISDMDLPPEKQTEGYKIKITLTEKFFDEKEEIMYGYSFKKPTQKVGAVEKYQEYENNQREADKILKENLERRFNALLKFNDFDNYIMLELDYISFIGNNKILGEIVETLVLENKISKDIMRNLCLSFSVINSDIKGEDNKPIFPTFFTKKVEEKMQLRDHILELLHETLNEDKKTGLSNFNQIKKIHSRSEEDLYVMQKLHNDIMEKLTLAPLKKQQNAKVSFEKNTSILKFNNKEIMISKSRDTAAHYLLTTIFENKEKIWNFDEIAEELGNDYDKNSWTKYYNACYKVNEKIAKDTTVKDFLEISTKTVGINKKYI